jgi:hypothetical protein
MRRARGSLIGSVAAFLILHISDTERKRWRSPAVAPGAEQDGGSAGEDERLRRSAAGGCNVRVRHPTPLDRSPKRCLLICRNHRKKRRTGLMTRRVDRRVRTRGRGDVDAGTNAGTGARSGGCGANGFSLVARSYPIGRLKSKKSPPPKDFSSFFKNFEKKTCARSRKRTLGMYEGDRRFFFVGRSFVTGCVRHRGSGSATR